MRRALATVASVLWMIPVTALLLIFAGLFAVVDAVMGDEDDGADDSRN